jgi:hypothetical protein
VVAQVTVMPSCSSSELLALGQALDARPPTPTQVEAMNGALPRLSAQLALGTAHSAPTPYTGFPPVAA